MFIVQECKSYLFVQLRNAPEFCNLETFPTNLQHIYETYYVLFTKKDGNTPIIFPYGQRRYNPSKKFTDTPLRAIYCPWKELVTALKVLGEKWEMKGKLIFSYFPEVYKINSHIKLPNLSYYLSQHSYGYVASVEQWARLRRPDDFPVSSDWLYKTSYLTFNSCKSNNRIFFPYSVQGWVLSKENDFKRWKMLAEEKCDYLNPRVIQQLYFDNWDQNGRFDMEFVGIDALENEQDIVQFLFDKQNKVEIKKQPAYAFHN